MDGIMILLQRSALAVLAVHAICLGMSSYATLEVLIQSRHTYQSLSSNLMHLLVLLQI